MRYRHQDTAVFRMRFRYGIDRRTRSSGGRDPSKSSGGIPTARSSVWTQW
jgi:hypothetical protein